LGAFDVADRVVALLGDAIAYDTPDRSFSPFWSNVGLGFRAGVGAGAPGLASAAGFAGGPAAATDAAPELGHGAPGIAACFLHVNRITRTLGAPFLEAPGRWLDEHADALSVVQRLDGGRLRVAFAATDAFVVESEGLPSVRLAWLDDPELARLRLEGRGAVRRWRALLPTLDARDPDAFLPLTVAVRVVRGRWDEDDGGRVLCDADGTLCVVVALGLLDSDDADLDARLDAAAGFDEALARSRRWLADALGPWRPPAPSPDAERLAATAAFALLANTCAAPGAMKGRLASFPSRGGYPVHFLWDACFHTLALERFAPPVARDALEVLLDAQRADGKVPQFVASTWVRPGASQPPLLGWAGERMVEHGDDLPLARRLVAALDANHRWWRAQRGTRFGLIACDDPFETGWDDSPRLDDGPILALDQNAYLLRQLRATARLAARVGDDAVAARSSAHAEALARAIVAHLYDPDRNLFLDADAASGARRPLLTPAAFLPLWAGVPLPRDRVDAMVRGALLDPRRLFGAVPFPSVAYDEDAYRPGAWWRGPSWPPIMMLMIETLRGLGYEDAARDAEARTYRTILADGELRELFDSATGRGLGQRHQGWTAAVFLWIAARQARPKEAAG
jgi:hypothetical protein